jgi:hypothetical protein
MLAHTEIHITGFSVFLTSDIWPSSNITDLFSAIEKNFSQLDVVPLYYIKV